MNGEDKTYMFKSALNCDFLRVNPYSSLLPLCTPLILVRPHRRMTQGANPEDM